MLAALRLRSRDNARTPMQWDGGAAAGFTTGTPWIAVNPNYPEINAAAQIDDPESVFAHFRAVIELRHTDPVVAYGDFTMLLPNGSTGSMPSPATGGAAPCWWWPTSPASRRALQCPTSRLGRERSWSWGTIRRQPAPSDPDAIVLRPWEARIYRRTGDAGPLRRVVGRRAACRPRTIVG